MRAGLLAEALRDHVARSLVVAADGEALAGLPQLRLGADERQTFVLPREAVSGLDGAARQAAIGLLLESVDVMPQIDAATAWWSAAVGAALGEPKDEVVPWWGLHALYTSGDGNCLLHAALLCTLGIRDRREAIEGEPGASTPEEIAAVGRRTLRGAPPALVHRARARARPAGAPLGGAGSSRSVLHGNRSSPATSLPGAPLRPPIICTPPPTTRRATRRWRRLLRLSGRAHEWHLLAHLLDRRSSSAPPPSREPIVVCFTSGHFSAMVPAAAAADASVYAALGIGAADADRRRRRRRGARAAIALSRPPAASCRSPTSVPLPVVFAPEGWETARDLPSYLNIEHATLPVLMADGTPTGTAERVAVALLRVPPETSLRGGDHAAAYCRRHLRHGPPWQRAAVEPELAAHRAGARRLELGASGARRARASRTRDPRFPALRVCEPISIQAIYSLSNVEKNQRRAFAFASRVAFARLSRAACARLAPPPLRAVADRAPAPAPLQLGARARLGAGGHARGKGSESAVTAMSTAASAVRSSPRRAMAAVGRDLRRRRRAAAASLAAAAPPRASGRPVWPRARRACSSARSARRAAAGSHGSPPHRLAAPRDAAAARPLTTRSPPRPAIRTAGAPIRLWKAGIMTVACSVPSPRTVQPRRCGFNFGLSRRRRQSRASSSAPLRPRPSRVAD